jgi:hypothetical protein
MILTSRWYPLIPHKVQQAFYFSPTRFNIAHAGRRGGKTELCKRKLVKRAVSFSAFPDGRFAFGAPTHAQAIKIFWDDLIALVPKWALRIPRSTAIAISARTVYLQNGARIEVVGLDKPERIEGPPLDGFVGDEYGNFKETVWAQHVRPALSTLNRPGWADLIGVPEGRNHYFQLTKDAENREDWDVFTWHTSEINPDEAEAARGDVDALTYSQEYEGAFVSFQGMAYYAFDAELNCPPDGERIMYNPTLPLIFCHDFNRIPGNCLIAQEQPAPDWLVKRNNNQNRGSVVAAIDEIFFRQDSNTGIVCDELIRRWKHHKGEVFLHGDATGGAKVSSGTDGSDWDIVDAKLSPHFNLKERFPKRNPPIRVRINSMNTILRSADGYIGCIVDKKGCPMLIRDFESVTCNDAGEIEKTEKLLTHISDGISYFVAEEYPCGGGAAFSDCSI